MKRPVLTYFDISASRGEECRLALAIAGVDFEDRRLKRDEWLALKPNTPYGALPLLELPGHPPLAQSNAILALLGRRYGLLPKDDVEAARHEAMMCAVEDARQQVSPTMRIEDPAEKKAAREKLASTTLPAWAGFAERQVSSDGPFFGGTAISVADLKIYMLLRWIKSGALDHVPTTLFDAYPKLCRVFVAVQEHPRVREWAAKHA